VLAVQEVLVSHPLFRLQMVMIQYFQPLLQLVVVVVAVVYLDRLVATVALVGVGMETVVLLELELHPLFKAITVALA